MQDDFESVWIFHSEDAHAVFAEEVNAFGQVSAIASPPQGVATSPS